MCEVACHLLIAPLLTMCDSPHGRGEIFELHAAIGTAAAMLSSVHRATLYDRLAIGTFGMRDRTSWL